MNTKSKKKIALLDKAEPVQDIIKCPNFKKCQTYLQHPLVKCSQCRGIKLETKQSLKRKNDKKRKERIIK